jgi:manganese oxidase
MHARHLVTTGAGLSLLAALIHAWVMPEHLAEWWGYGAFFLLAAIFQTLYAVALLRHPESWLLCLGIAANLALIAIWVWTRTIGIPLVGPAAGELEPIGRIDVVAKVAEAGLVVVLAALLRVRRLPPVLMSGEPIRGGRDG